MSDEHRCGFTGNEVKLPFLQFDAEAYAPSERLDALNAFSRGLYHYTPPPGGEGSFQDQAARMKLRLSAWRLGCFSAACFENTPMVATSPDRTDDGMGDTLFLRIVKAGEVLARSDESERVLQPGAVHLMQSRNSVFPRTDGHCLSLRVPYDCIGYDPRRHRSLQSVPVTSWIGNLIVSTFESLFEKLPTMEVHEAREIEATLKGLVLGLVKATELDEATHHAIGVARNDAMKHFILKNLQSEDIGFARLQAKFGASRSTIYRAFEDVGGVARFIRDQRLRAVHRELSVSRKQRGVVQSIAESFGFWDQSSFFRAFRELYDLRPGDVVGTGLEALSGPREGPRTQSTISNLSLADFWSPGSSHARMARAF